MNLYSDFKLLNENLLILSSPSSLSITTTSPNEKILAAKDIRSHVESAARELSLERLLLFYLIINACFHITLISCYLMLFILKMLLVLIIIMSINYLCFYLHIYILSVIIIIL